MASKIPDVYEATFRKYFGDKLINLTDKATEDEIKQVYADLACEYDKDISNSQGAWHKPMAEIFDDAVKQVFQDKKKDQIKIVDACAGTGLTGIELHNLGYTDLHALDISQEMLNEAKKKIVYKSFVCAPLSQQRIPEIDTGEFDALICTGALVPGHVRSSALKEMVRMVKTGGFLCFEIPKICLDDYQEKMSELEKAERWEQLSKITVPLFKGDGLPPETVAFTYKVLKH